MRGLTERIALAKARIAAVADPDGDDADCGAACFDAYELGVREYRSGEFSAPIMFQDEPLLLRAWAHGQDCAAEMAEMAWEHGQDYAEDIDDMDN